MNTDTTYSLRLITPADVQQVLDIYAPYVLHTAITFDYEVPSTDEFIHKIETITAQYPWIGYFEGDQLLGYAYASRHRPKAAYEWSPESTIYVREGHHGKGIGRILYEELFRLLREQGYFNVFAGVLIPNEGSERLHKSVGFEEIGIFRKIGYKLGNWQDVKWFQLRLQEGTPGEIKGPEKV
jgi:phosphinothricin acetyltransferase